MDASSQNRERETTSQKGKEKRGEMPRAFAFFSFEKILSAYNDIFMCLV